MFGCRQRLESCEDVLVIIIRQCLNGKLINVLLNYQRPAKVVVYMAKGNLVQSWYFHLASHRFCSTLAGHAHRLRPIKGTGREKCTWMCTYVDGASDNQSKRNGLTKKIDEAVPHSVVNMLE